MLPMLLGIIASAIGGSAGTTIHPPEERPKGEFELPMASVGGGRVAPARDHQAVLRVQV